MQELRDKEAEDRQRAQLIEANLVEIDALLDLIRTSRKNSMDWQELTRLIVEAAKQGGLDQIFLCGAADDLQNDPRKPPHEHTLAEMAR